MHGHMNIKNVLLYEDTFLISDLRNNRHNCDVRLTCSDTYIEAHNSG